MKQEHENALETDQNIIENDSEYKHLGAYLKTLRERRGIGLDMVENHTKIRQKHLKTIEGEHLNEDTPLPNTYYRGYLRTYCQFFGLEHKEYTNHILSQYPNEQADRSENNQFHTQTHSSYFTFLSKNKNQSMKQVPFFIASIVGLFMLSYFMDINSKETSEASHFIQQ